MKYLTLTVSVAIFLNACAYPGSKMDPKEIGDDRVTPIEITSSVIRQLSLVDQTAPLGTRVAQLTSDLSTYTYRVGPQDVLTIIVWDHPELTIPAGQFRSPEDAGHLVLEDGTIFYPFVGKIRVQGMTVGEIRSLITERLSRQIRNPQVDVRVAAFRSQRVYVVGEVNNPGVQPITDTALTAIDAISMSGDVTQNADMTNITLTRGGETYNMDLLSLYELGKVDQNIVLQHGDIISVPDRNLQKVFVLGSVLSPSSQIMHKGRLTLAEAISDAGGFNEEKADASGVYVVRGADSGPTLYHLDARSPGVLILADQFQLQPRDVVYVETSGEARLEDRLSRIAILTRIINDLSDTRVRVIEDLN